MKKMASAVLADRVSIKRFEAQDFLGIKHLVMDGIPSDNRWIFLTGENGFGKTSVLQALAIALQGFPERHNFEVFKRRFKTNLTLSIRGNEKLLETVGGNFQLSDRPLKKNDVFAFASYGASRLNIAGDSNSPTIGLFSSLTYLNDIETKLLIWFLEKDEKFDFTELLLKKLIPSLDRIKIKPPSENIRVFYIERDETGKKYEPLPFSNLASGHRSLIAMIGDLLLRLYQMQPGIADPAELSGVVLIDEIDLHFHPNLQRRLPSLLSEIFPKIQFIASTHSPIPILGAPAESVFFRTMRTQEDGIFLKKLDHIEVKNLTPNTILTSPIFGFTDLISEAHDGKTRLRTEETYDDLKLNDVLKKRLRAFAADSENEFDGLFGPSYKPGKVG